ncbi:ABC transporter [Oenococcus sp. UCMA 17063]|nr:ABC transporter [Oenococcus sp. UCMA 17063]
MINMLNFKGQLIDASMQRETHLSIFEFLLAMTIYIIVFVLGSVMFFKQEDF